MPKFKYKANNSLGLRVSGSVVASSENAALSELRMKGFSQISLSQSAFGGFFADLDAKLKKSTSSTKVSFLNGA